MASKESTISRTLFQRHEHLTDAWVAAFFSAAGALAGGLTVTSLIIGGVTGWNHVWPLFALPIVAAYLLNMSAMFALAAKSCDPKNYGSRKPWMLGLFGSGSMKLNLLEQTLNWTTHRGRNRLSAIANS